MSRTLPPHRWLLGLLLLSLGSAGIAAAWVLLALSMNRQCSWMAVVAALDAAFLLRYVRYRPGMVRALLALAGTALAIALANWWIAASQTGASVGMPPWEAIARMGWMHAWILSDLANGPISLVTYAAALLTAASFGVADLPRLGRRSPNPAVVTAHQAGREMSN